MDNISSRVVKVLAPIDGIVFPLEKVPDPVFAQKMVGDGLSIDPTTNILKSPVDGEIIQIHSAGHAVTVRTSNEIEILIHIGLDTVQLGGDGFSVKVKKGDSVKAGETLIEFDLDKVAQKAKSLLTQIVVSTMDRVDALDFADKAKVTVADEIFSIKLSAAEAGEGETTDYKEILSEAVVIPNPSGLHARPASILAGFARQFNAKLELVIGNKHANAQSVSAIMALEIEHGDKVAIKAVGKDAQAAIDYILPQLEEGLGEDLDKARQEAQLTPKPLLPIELKENELGGIPASGGLAVGNVFKLMKETFDIPENGKGNCQELIALKYSIDQATLHLSSLKEKLETSGSLERAAIFNAHLELLDDPEMIETAESLINKGKSAAFAWHSSYTSHSERLESLKNQLLAARANDLRDVGKRVLRILLGINEEKAELVDNTIVIAEDLTPSDVINLDMNSVVGCCTVSGGATSHVAILARSMGIPAIVGADPAIFEIENGVQVILDGENGKIILEPTHDLIEKAEEQIELAEKTKKEEKESAQKPAVTKDGITITVAANTSSVDTSEKANKLGADGIGLLRSEFLFMNRSTAPSEDEQFETYKAAAEKLGKDKTLIIRTLDVGGDKPLSYLPIPKEENPFLGERGIRVVLNRPEILRTQLRAILRAAKEHKLKVMFPMIASLDEFIEAKKLMFDEAKKLSTDPIPVGIMVEVPSTAVMASVFAPEVDFFSIGTNDLTQYTLAMDRGHPKLAAQIDAMHPAVLKMIDMVVQAADRLDKEVSVCGGLASDKLGALALLGLGVKKLSVSVPLVPSIKAEVRRASQKSCAETAKEALKTNSPVKVRELFKNLQKGATK
jgi:phosphocarrier protein FPr